MSKSPSFLRLPLAVQIMYIKVRNCVDKFAKIDTQTGVITYTEKSHPKLERKLSPAESKRIFNDLYV